jgi:hypothetical protein
LIMQGGDERIELEKLSEAAADEIRKKFLA